MKAVIQANQVDLRSFKLDEDFVKSYKTAPKPFGFDGLGEFVYRRTYSRKKVDGTNEDWYETVERVINGTYSIQKKHIIEMGCGWEEEKGQKSAKEMYDRVFKLKFIPPGRGLWAMGTPIIYEHQNFAALNNCAFITTGDVGQSGGMAFAFLMDASMLGVGCGFDTRGKDKLIVQGSSHGSKDNFYDSQYSIYGLNNFGSVILGEDDETAEILIKIRDSYIDLLNIQIAEYEQEILDSKFDWDKERYAKDIKKYVSEIERVSADVPITSYAGFIISDTREGWVKATEMLINTEFYGGKPILFDYSQIRKKGEPLKTFGGIASGPIPLIDMHIDVKHTLEKNKKIGLTETSIVDIMNLIGKCVIAGNVRRTAEIALGPHDSTEFMELKDYQKHPERMSYGWCSNNSVYATIGMDYKPFVDKIVNNGEPGFFWLENAQKYSRMNGHIDNKDHRAVGTNPCSEQTLESSELCCLVEVCLNRAESMDDFLRTLKFAYLYAKTVTLGKTHWIQTNRIMTRNRRIGCSLTGITQFIAKNNDNMDLFKNYLERGYSVLESWDEIYSGWFAVPKSIKITSIKPSGCVTENTKILTENGPMTMKEIFQLNGYNDLPKDTSNQWLDTKCALHVINKNGELEPISKLYVNGKSKVYNITLADGSVVKCTGEHKWLVLTDGEKEWKRTDEIAPGDKIINL